MVRPTILAIALTATLCFGNACDREESDRSGAPQLDGRKTAPQPPDRPLVDELDRGIQDRFKDVRDEDIHNRSLGTSRVAFLGLRRLGTIRKELKSELRSLARISSSGWETAVYVAEPGKEGTINGPLTASSDSWVLFPNLDGVREVADRALATGAPARGRGRGVALEARPVTASKAMCLECHRRNRIGEPLGAVVYAFRDAVLPALLERSTVNSVTSAAVRDIRSGGP
jgi:hypothetical protein